MQCVRLVSGITFISMFKVKNTWWFSCLITSICTWNFVNDCENSYEKKVLTALVNHSPISKKRTNTSHLNSLDIKTQQHMAFRDQVLAWSVHKKPITLNFKLFFSEIISGLSWSVSWYGVIIQYLLWLYVFVHFFFQSCLLKSTTVCKSK
jgi:hypothetical protein